jgi:Type II secretion system protein C
MDPARRLSLGPLLLAVLIGLGSASGSRPSEAQPPAPGAATPAEGATPRLIGVVIAQDGRGRAYLQDARTGGVRAYEVGEAVGDAQVVAIEPDRVVIDRSGSRIDIRFSRMSGGEGAPGPTGPAVAPQAEPAAPPAAEAGPSPDPAAGSQPPAAAPGQPAAPAADPQPCPPNCPAPAAPVRPGPRPSP